METRRSARETNCVVTARNSASASAGSSCTAYCNVACTSELSLPGNRLAASGKSRDAERDISEKIALGRAQPTYSQEAMYDQRLFNQSKVPIICKTSSHSAERSAPQGLDSGFGADDDYNVYSKPLFAQQRNKEYVPTKGMEIDDEGRKYCSAYSPGAEVDLLLIFRGSEARWLQRRQ